MLKDFFTPKDVRDLTGISYRQIQYWDKTEFVGPSYKRGGVYRCYTFADLLLLKMAKLLRDNHFSIQRLRGTIVDLRGELRKPSPIPLTEMSILVKGGDILVARDVTTNASYIRLDAKDLVEEINKLYPPPEDNQLQEATI